MIGFYPFSFTCYFTEAQPNLRVANRVRKISYSDTSVTDRSRLNVHEHFFYQLSIGKMSRMGSINMPFNSMSQQV